MLLVLVAAFALDGAPVTMPEACDMNLVRAVSQRTLAEYRLEGVHARDGVVSLLFRSQDGSATFAIALHASGTQLSTSVMGMGLDAAALARVSTPVATWWQQADLQHSLASCCSATSQGTVVDLPAAARRTLDASLVRQDRAVRVGPLRVSLLLGGAWIALVVFTARAVLRLATSGKQRYQLVGLFGFSLMLNWGLCSGGPDDLRLNLAPIWAADDLELRWGPAPIALFRLLALPLDGIDDTHILWTNLLLSSVLPVLMFGIITELGISKAASLLTAFITAAHPLLIAFSGDLGRQATYLFAALGSILGLLGFLQRGGAVSFIAFVIGVVLATTSRPEGAHVLVVHVAILLWISAARRRRALAGVALMILGGLAFGYVRYFLEYGPGLTNRTLTGFGPPTALLWAIVLDPDFTPLGWIVVWIAGLALGWRLRAAWVALGSLAGLHIAWTLTGLYEMFVGCERQVASARYESILLVPLAIATAVFVEVVLAARTWVKVGVAGTVAVFILGTLARPYETLLRPFTVDYEYEFLKRQALTLPPRSQIYIFQAPVDDIGFIDAAFVGPFVGSDVSFAVWDSGVCDVGTATDKFLYIGSSCAGIVDHPQRPLGLAYARWQRDCASMRAQVVPRAVEEIDVPAHKMSWHDFEEPTVRLGVYRLQCPAISPSARRTS